MKTTLTILFLGISTLASAQVGIGGKNDFTGSSAILDFGTETGSTVDGTDDRAIVLLPTNGLPAGAVNGTLAVVDDGTQTALRYFENGAWNSISTGGPSGVATTGTDIAKGEVIIGATTSTAPGVLILESNDKALVLPQVANGRFTLKATAGMIYYDTIDKTVYAYDGSTWKAY